MSRLATTSTLFLGGMGIHTWGQLADYLDISLDDLIQDEDIRRNDLLWNCQQVDGYAEQILLGEL